MVPVANQSFPSPRLAVCSLRGFSQGFEYQEIGGSEWFGMLVAKTSMWCFILDSVLT